MVRTDSAEARRSALALGSPAFPEAGGLPAVLDVPSAGRLLGIGRTVAYRLVAAGEFPCRVLRVGSEWKVPTADLLAVLGLPVASLSVSSGRHTAYRSDDKTFTW
jgi:hypothetical protein